jgi:hypothetical protein
VLEVIATTEREPAVGDVCSDRCASRCDRLGWRWDIRIEILQTQHVRVRACGGGYSVDVETDDLGEARCADLLCSHDGSVVVREPGRRRGATTMFRSSSRLFPERVGELIA